MHSHYNAFTQNKIFLCKKIVKTTIIDDEKYLYLDETHSLSIHTHPNTTDAKTHTMPKKKYL